MTEEWLVRTARGMISRPMSQDELIGLLRQGQLTPQDEICKANSYWIALHETQEVRSQLGVSPQSLLSKEGVPREEDTTETQAQNPHVLPSPPSAAVLQEPMVLGHGIERVSLWRYLVYGLVFIVGALIVAVFRALR